MICIDFKNIDKYLSLGQIEEKLIQVYNRLDIKIRDKCIVVGGMHRILWDIKNGIMQMKHDTRNTQSIRNVIGISIAMCAIVTLCIVLPIVLHNKNRANTEVRLHNWI